MNMDEILAKLEKQSRQQLRFTKILCALCALMLVLAIDAEKCSRKD